MNTNNNEQLRLFANNDELSGAIFTTDRAYRGVLWRIWDGSKPKIMFIGLNPSEANENTDDPTIRRVKTFAKNWGYGGIYMLNLFTYVTAYPEFLLECENPSYMANDFLIEYASKSAQIIFAWGAFKKAKERAKEVIKMFPSAMTLAINKDGSPKHPLYVKGDTIPFLHST